MHYKNGRQAKAGDKVVVINAAGCPQVGESGILYDLNGQSETCNARLAKIKSDNLYVNINSCLHIDDIVAANIPVSAGTSETEPEPTVQDAGQGKEN